jgi:hypothetical protein
MRFYIACFILSFKIAADPAVPSGFHADTDYLLEKILNESYFPRMPVNCCSVTYVSAVKEPKNF